MAEYALAEILTTSGNRCAVFDVEQLERELADAGRGDAMVALAVAAGDADHPMIVLAAANSDGEVHWLVDRGSLRGLGA